MTKPYIIGIAGGSGSGKTSFLRDIKSRFEDHQLTILSMDDYYQPAEKQWVDPNGVTNFDLPSSIDGQAFATDIRNLISGKTVEREEYVFNNDEAVPKTLVFKPAPILIIEGLFVFYFQEIWELLDLKVFLHTKDVFKIIRRIKRDARERNYPIDDVMYRYQYHVLPAYNKFIQPYEEKVDLVVVNNDSYDIGLNVITGFMENLLVKHSDNKDI